LSKLGDKLKFVGHNRQSLREMKHCPTCNRVETDAALKFCRIDAPADIGRTKEPKLMTLVPGTKLGHYEICSKIGAGGMGELYLAQDIKLDRKVA